MTPYAFLLWIVGAAAIVGALVKMYAWISTFATKRDTARTAAALAAETARTAATLAAETLRVAGNLKEVAATLAETTEKTASHLASETLRVAKELKEEFLENWHERDVKIERVLATVHRIEIQTTTTNGRVTAIEGRMDRLPCAGEHLSDCK